MTKKPGMLLQHQLESEFSNYPLSDFSDSDIQQINTLLAVYYRYTPAVELESESASDLLGAVIAHWQLLKERNSSVPAVRVYNPSFEEHGWQSSHTIIEVACDDMAFLVDSLSMGINQAGLTIHLTIHPVIKTQRNKAGELQSLYLFSDTQGSAESLIRFHVEKQLSQDLLDELQKMLLSIINDVRCANQGWMDMRSRISSVRDVVAANQLPVSSDELVEAVEFLEWLRDGHFTFLAYCEYELDNEGERTQMLLSESSILGFFREPGGGVHSVESVVPDLGETLSTMPSLVVVTKANVRSTVHRPAYMDLVAVKRFDSDGNIVGLYCFVGLFASTAYSSPPRNIPLLRKKMVEVVEGAGLSSMGHSEKALTNLLDTYPRDALFQVPTDELRAMAMDILGLQERQRTRLFVTQDPFKRFFSCLVYLPRESYSKELKVCVQGVLVEAFQGVEVEFATRFSESILARLSFIVHSPPGVDIEYDSDELQSRVVEATTTWQDGLRDALMELYGETLASHYLREYAHSFPGGYREDFYPRTAADDIARIETARESGELGLHFYRPILESTDKIHFRLYSLAKTVPLSEVIPILENMGLSVFGERPYHVRHQSGDVWIHDFSMRYPRGLESLADEESRRLQETFLKVWKGEVDDDGFNQLVPDAGLGWKQVVLLRAYSRYLKQIKVPFSQPYIIDTLAQHSTITCHLVQLFELKFSPDSGYTERKFNKLLDKLVVLLEGVESLDQDRIIRSFINLIQATLRTNFFQSADGGKVKDYISLKIDSSVVVGMPQPVPMFEIFVFSSRMEGVHLRGGRIARGGLRWSDRMEDYRTEVLGLMKAQMVKNTVIVPVGSKGGFIVKRMPDTDNREELTAEVIFCYKTLLMGMLDLTDNLVAGEVMPPQQLVRHDTDDPYLVIAADKGTATFSDIANGVAEAYDFWLGDAFASGGSVGYDHKRMGITAKGAWESVKRNFRELSVDIQTTDFRVIGIGDMAGDVFGNGMLLSRHIKLVAAFNHQHIFLDPTPDPEVSFVERERLFLLPRSTWKDYDKQLISKGGGLYLRRAKSITLTQEVKEMLGIKDERMTPNELIHVLLKAQVDLLWNGGIGTYVKAESESHEDAGDKANDALRVNGGELRCKVVGEGGNLGFTQLGRIEYAIKGGLIYTDSIDNSAGVDCSDHEVNIKILLNQILANGDMTRKQRDSLLEAMTDEVSQLVLADNYAQTQSVSMVASEAPQRLYEHSRFIDFLEQKGMLNRELECLPDKKDIAQRQAAGTGLTKPEISTLHAYSKMTYYDALINSDIPDDPFLLSELVDYFPTELGKRFHQEMLCHSLKREIIATHLTNGIVDHIGPGFGYRVREDVGVNIAGVTRAYLAASKIFTTDVLWKQIEQLDNRVSAAVQAEMMCMVSEMLEQTVSWILRSRRNNVVVRELVDYFQKSVTELTESLPKPLAAKNRLDLNKQIKHLVNAGVPRELAQRVSAVVPLTAALDIVEIGCQCDKETPLVASLYFNLGRYLELHWLHKQIDHLEVQTHWHNLAKRRITDTLNAHQRELTAQVLKTVKPYKSSNRMIDQWVAENSFACDGHHRMISDLKARSSVDFAMLSVVVAGVGNLLVADL
ncbi:MAG: NAD-glutamate dehydrogenase [Sedimenticola sp.]